MLLLAITCYYLLYYRCRTCQVLAAAVDLEELHLLVSVEELHLLVSVEELHAALGPAATAALGRQLLPTLPDVCIDEVSARDVYGP